MNLKLKKALDDYLARRRKIQSVAAELQMLEDVHQDQTRVELGLADGDLIDVRSLATVIDAVMALGRDG